MEDRIKLSLPACTGEEIKYIKEALAGDWIVPLGPQVDYFEELLGEYLDAPGRVVALSSGTAALHLGLVMLGVEAGDEVICQDLTFSASANPIVYQGAHPVFVDSEIGTMNISPEFLEQAICERIAVTGRRPKAIVAVDLYGMPAKWDEILSIADRYDIPVLEDAAEALGSEYKGRKCGNFGRYGVLSFNGNKMITTSGGGALICPDVASARRVKFFATQARENKPYYYHEHIGYNYRLSNISGGIGCAQMGDLARRVERRRSIHDFYKEELCCIDLLKVQDNPSADYVSNFWLTTIQIQDTKGGITPELVRQHMDSHNIETRLLWRPMHMQPVFSVAPYYGSHVGEELFGGGLCLPSGASLRQDQLQKVVDSLKEILQ